MKLKFSLALAIIALSGTVAAAPADYSQAQVTIAKSINGVEKVIGSTVVKLNDNQEAGYTETFSYMSDCSSEKGKTTCNSKNTPLGLLATVNLVDKGKTDRDAYVVNVSYRNLVDLPEAEHDGYAIQLPTINVLELKNQTVKHTDEMARKGQIISTSYTIDAETGVKDETIVRMRLM